MSEQWTRDTGDRHEEVIVTQQPGYEQRQEIVENVAAARNEALNKITQLIWLFFGLLEALIALRVLLKLIGSNPASPFAGIVYMVSDLFLWPFAGLTPTPGVGPMVLEIPSIIAMLVYAVVAWAIIRLVWLAFPQRSTRSVTTYERDRTIR